MYDMRCLQVLGNLKFIFDLKSWEIKYYDMNYECILWCSKVCSAHSSHPTPPSPLQSSASWVVAYSQRSNGSEMPVSLGKYTASNHG